MEWGTILAITIPILALIGGVIAFVFKVGKWVSNRESFEKTVMGFVTEVRDFFAGLDPPILLRKSPVTLTEFGKKIANAIEGAAWAKEHASKISDKVKDKNPYEIQEFSFHYMGKEGEFEPEDEFLRKMQKYAYENGISMDNVKKALSIELRDALLVLHGLPLPE